MIYEFMATQSFNGYDKPWAPGAGPNLLDPENPDTVTAFVSGSGEVSRPGRLFDSLEPGKYVAKNFGEQYVDEALSNYDTINSGGTIGGLLETMAFVSMVENVKQELKDRR